MIITPGQINRFVEFYHQVAHMLQAGIPLPKVIETLRNATGSRGFRKALTIIRAELQQGGSLEGALAQTGRWLPRFDIALLTAGEKSGRLDECAIILSDYYRERYVMARDVIRRVAYPVFIVFFAVMLFPPSSLVALIKEGDLAGFILPKLKFAAVTSGIVLLLLWLGQSRRSDWWRSIWELLLHRIPVLGKARRALALARLSLALDALLNAGINIMTAWELAADASGSAALKRAAARARNDMEGGATPGEAITATRAFPETFVTMYCSGEVSGRLDEALEYLRKNYLYESQRRFKTLAFWVPMIIYLGIIMVLGYFIVTFWLGYFDNMLNAF
ncbi:MAG: type II secretion system F family protein [Verrucomicrobiales bacterium]|nr:type II secretion system F family protein [Verrucomicrobiales bacterium]